ncbi:DUF7002 family protein [Actinomycetospora sp. CA-101289]|uniref:DUF7002 family protein n=1 Tax=Actinomycetospora sp. CA-101289 TaxID=3239893 RepID=UPI003D958A15
MASGEGLSASDPCPQDTVRPSRCRPWPEDGRGGRQRAARLRRLWSIGRYADGAQIVLTLNTASVLDAHGPDVVLTTINSGAVHGPSGRRGTHTFRGVADFPAQETVAEFAVAGGIPDVAAHLRRAETRRPRPRTVS